MPDEKNIDVDVVDEEKKEDFEDICFLCRRPESKVGKMVHLPNDIHICQNCMQKVFDSMGKGGMNFQDMSNCQVNRKISSHLPSSFYTAAHLKCPC